MSRPGHDDFEDIRSRNYTDISMRYILENQKKAQKYTRKLIILTDSFTLT